MTANIRPYTLAVPDEALLSLKNKLDVATFADSVQPDDWSYGVPQTRVRELAAYWAEGFDWRAQEARINLLPQYTTEVQLDEFGPLTMHFVHQRSSKAGSIPLLFSHGCEFRSASI